MFISWSGNTRKHLLHLTCTHTCSRNTSERQKHLRTQLHAQMKDIFTSDNIDEIPQHILWFWGTESKSVTWRQISQSSERPWCWQISAAENPAEIMFLFLSKLPQSLALNMLAMQLQSSCIKINHISLAKNNLCAMHTVLRKRGDGPTHPHV